MGLVPVLVVASLTLSVIGVSLYFWAVRSGQYDDLEGHAHRALHDGPPLTDREP